VTIKSLKTKTIQAITGLLLLAGSVAMAQPASPRVIPGTVADDFGTLALGGPRATATLTFTFTSGGSLGGPPAVLTLGAPGLDFTDAGTGSLTVNGAHAYRAGDTGTVDVVFRPTLPGSRSGAVVLWDRTGAVVATTYLQGLGSGPQVVFQPWTATPVPLPSVSSSDAPPTPTGVAVDGAGHIYVADPANNRVVMESQAMGGTQTVVYAQPAIPGAQGVSGVALDGAGNVYIADTPNNQVLKLVPRRSGTVPVFDPAVVLGGLNAPRGVAVGGAGTVYIADTGNNQVLQLAWSGTAYAASAQVVDAALAGPQGVAVDAAGDVIIADTGEYGVWVETASGGGYSRIGLPGLEGFGGAVGLVLDPAGDILVAENRFGPVILNTPQGGGYASSRILIGAPLTTPCGMAMDGLGNLFIADSDGGQVVRIDQADPPDLTFAATPVGVASPDSPQSVTVWNIGNADLILPVPASGADPVFPAGWSLDAASTLAATTSLSGAPGVLAAGTSATLAIDFAPACAGPAEGSLVLTDTALNAAGPAYAAQAILLTGWGSGIYITPSTLPHGRVGAAYALALAGAGGTAPYTLSLAAGALPPGLGLGASGSLTGTPTAAGTFPFTILGTDSTPATGSSPLSLTIDPGAATVTLGSLAQTYSGLPLAATVTTNPPGLAVALTYDGGPGAPVAAGSHAVVATVADPGYQGSATGTLVIAKAAGTVTLAGLAQTFTGSPLAASASTVPPGLGVALTYDGSATAPTAPGAYAVLATLADPDYQGSASGTLVIAKAAGTVTLAGLAQTFTGSPLPVTASTVPPGLGVALTYDGDATAPTAPGSYAVLATLSDPDYQGSASGTLVISEAAAKVLLTVSGDDHLGDPETLTAMVSGSTTASRAGAAAAPAPTGTVTFMDGTSALATVALSGGRAVYATTALAVGPHALSAVYSGDAEYPGSQSATHGEVVVPAALAIQAPDQDLALSPGGAVTTELSLGSVGAFAGGPITLTVTGLPAGFRAEFSPAVLAALPATVTLRIFDRSRTLAVAGTGPVPGPWAGPVLAAAVLLSALAGSRRRALPARAALVLAIGLACGSPPPYRPVGPPAPGPRPANDTLTVTAAAPGLTLATCTLHLTSS